MRISNKLIQEACSRSIRNLIRESEEEEMDIFTKIHRFTPEEAVQEGINSLQRGDVEIYMNGYVDEYYKGATYLCLPPNRNQSEICLHFISSNELNVDLFFNLNYNMEIKNFTPGEEETNAGPEWDTYVDELSISDAFVAYDSVDGYEEDKITLNDDLQQLLTAELDKYIIADMENYEYDDGWTDDVWERDR